MIVYDCLDRYEFSSVLDAFGGSGMVSCLFKRMGKSTNNDAGSFIFDNFHDIYYLDEENLWLDNMICNIAV